MKTATPQDTYDHLFCSGALQYDWWYSAGYLGVSTGELSPEWSVELTADNGDGGETTVTVNHKLVMKTAKEVLANKGKALTLPSGTSYPAWSLELERNCSALVFDADDADFDADSADELLQLIVLGEVVFG